MYSLYIFVTVPIIKTAIPINLNRIEYSFGITRYIMQYYMAHLSAPWSGISV